LQHGMAIGECEVDSWRVTDRPCLRQVTARGASLDVVQGQNLGSCKAVVSLIGTGGFGRKDDGLR
jgi:hypothetical protein